MAKLDSMIVLRISTTHRIAQEHDQFDLRQYRGYPFWSMRIEQVGRTGFTGHKGRLAKALSISPDHAGREMSAIPAHPFMKFLIKEMSIFCRGGIDRGMGLQVVIEGGGTAALCADDQEIGQEPQRTADPSVQLLLWRKWTVLANLHIRGGR